MRMYSKIYHIALIICAPYFVNLNNNTFQLKTLLFFAHLRSRQENRKSSLNIKFTVLSFWRCYFESSNHK